MHSSLAYYPLATANKLNNELILGLQESDDPAYIEDGKALTDPLTNPQNVLNFMQFF